jgi:uncharacterized repeat protein (TIGR03803 family)
LLIVRRPEREEPLGANAEAAKWEQPCWEYGPIPVGITKLRVGYLRSLPGTAVETCGLQGNPDQKLNPLTCPHTNPAVLPPASPSTASREAGLILSGSTLYGTTSGGGSGGKGTVFAINTDGTGFTVLNSFTGYPIYWDFAQSGLILSGNTLYGTASQGGTNGYGTVFALNTDGTGFTVLYSFTGGSDGGNPTSGLILSGNTLYGTAALADLGPVPSPPAAGTVFAVNTDGSGFTNLHSFGGSDGAWSHGLILSGNTLYGTASGGGSLGDGTVFSIFIQPQLTLTPSGPYVILTWPTNYSGFTLQSTTDFASSAVWTTNSSPPVVIGGQNVVINTMSGTQQFFRLSQ